MTAPADTAEIPRVAPARLTPPPIRLVPPLADDPSATVVVPVTIGPAMATPVAVCRADLTAERKALRHSRRMWGLAGLSVLAASLGATVTVLDVFH